MRYLVDTGRNNYLWTLFLMLWVLHTMAASFPAWITAMELTTFRFLIRMSCKWQDFICTCSVFGETSPCGSRMSWVSELSSYPVGLAGMYGKMRKPSILIWDEGAPDTRGLPERKSSCEGKKAFKAPCRNCLLQTGTTERIAFLWQCLDEEKMSL